ncbi:family 78 glycoside hydrolase catalytic domain [Mangrovibacterium marinum]|uniref:family 78 glycoside hydrolase catalytic domain n=1 Tax=Mangrovibacterium marinum TaxID=1639118 RepID=UPI002A1874A9|nr:family 78 glycoside hydrolase catalytic domain [Mangrovibacterium marinum]
MLSGIKKSLFLFAALLFFMPAIAQVEVTQLYVENKINPTGIDVLYPRLSWTLESSKRNMRQSAFDIRVSESLESLQKGVDLIFSTGKIPSDQSVFVQFTGNTLKPGRKYYWQVRVWDQNDRASKWSTPNYWIMGLMGPQHWQAKWIEAGVQDRSSRQSPIMRKEFALQKPVRLAVAFVTARGMYEAEINGKRVGDLYLTPGWTSYNKRLQYQTFDVTDLLNEGKNAIGVTLGDGWYRGKLGFNPKPDNYGKELALLFQMQVIYTDGTTEQIISDGSWLSSRGPILSSEIYDGEQYDARLEQEGWSKPGFVDVDWAAIRLANYPVINLVTTENEPIRKQEKFSPVKILTTPKGEKVLDFGQNLVGWVQVKATGKAGDQIRIQHAEVLDKEGNFYTANLRTAKQTNSYILKGGGEEIFEPHFCFQGFRYIKVEAYPGELKAENFTAFALYSDMQQTGSFSCSDDFVNRLQHNIQWSQRGNFLDVPTDCPQRDERLGWTGDAQAFAATAAFNFNVNSFYAKWLKDLAADQAADGSVPNVIPNILDEQCSPGWGDVATIAPWVMYRTYGDKVLLENQYESMKKWVKYIQNSAQNNLWKPKQSFGDWLFYRPEDDNSGRAAATDKDLIAQCFYAHSTQLLINAAKVLEKNYEVSYFDSLLTHIKDAFLHEYVTPAGRMVSGTQTAYVLALQFDMLPEAMRADAVERLVQNIHDYGDHLTTGFLGTPYLCHVLSRFGHSDLAYQLLLEKSYPSWLYPVTMGATTIWERWDGIKPDGTLQTPGMNSFNHYAYGAIGEWMYGVAAGIQSAPEVPGFKEIQIKPVVTRRLNFVEAEFQTYYGKLVSHWQWEQGQLLFQVSIPVNTSARVFIPAQSVDQIREDGRALRSHRDLELIGQVDGYVEVMLGSGDYEFQISR